MSISEKLAPVQRHVRESVKQDRRVKRTGQGKLFDAYGLDTQAAPGVDLAKIEDFG